MQVGQETDQTIWENQQKIPSHQLQLGHYVARLSAAWSETPFLLQGFVVADEVEKLWIQQHCEWVIVDIAKSRHTQSVSAAMQSISPNRPPSPLIKKPITAQSMKASLTTYLDLNKQARRIIDHFKDLGQDDVRTTVVSVRRMAMSLADNLPALVWLTRIKHEDAYTAEHCLNVCVLAMGLARTLGWNDRDVAQVGVAGLLHDLGKIDVDHRVLNKPGKLTQDEYEVMKQHPAYGYERLRHEPDLNERILNGIRHHHERPDGKGYPSGQTGSQIDDMAKIVAIVDAYDAITSNRVYQKARSHHEAMGILWRHRDTQFDGQMVESFIHFLGWVTPGTLVELSSGDLAVVIQAAEGQRLYPKVRILMPTNLGFRLGAIWDLSTMTAAEGETRIHIANVLPDGHLGIQLEHFVEQLFD